MNKITITDIDVQDKKVLMRVDFNVPITPEGGVGDDTRISAAIPSIEYVLKKGGSVVLMSHLGRPKGKPSPEFSLKPVAADLSKKLGIDVKFASDCVGAEATQMSADLKAGEVLLLENLRFHAEEEGKGVSAEEQEAFAKQLAAHGEVYVNDAFGTAHRAHASMAVVTKSFKDCAAGFLLEKEINYLAKTLEAPEKPFVAIIGGAKISGKIDVILNLMDKVDSLLIGGGMAYTFFKAMGRKIGGSIHEDDKMELALKIMKDAENNGVQLLLPVDNVIGDAFSADANIRIVEGDIPDGWEGMDIGPKTREIFTDVIADAKTVIWNGPMGCFEMAPFAGGTNAVATAVAETNCVSIIGGGDSVSAIKKAGLDHLITHISTGGGASLELMEGKALPGLEALTDK
ncbi:MAG: phosphoglycerate kinase [Verrucomicrobia bacterium]|nr:phosphoglycerate kinase [Verrucomicrobiota bacterium]MCH8512305.1 phosphoglycerate kinase [Kiritimatiellia bacterium]